MSNLTTRTVAGIGFVAVMLACLLLNEWLFGALVVFLTVTMLHEFYAMSMEHRHRQARIFAMIAGVSAVVLIFCMFTLDMHSKYLSVMVLPIIGVLFCALFDKHKDQMDDYAYILAGLLYIAAPLSLSNLVAFRGGQFDAHMLLDFFILIWCSDIGAYCIGTAFGQKENSRKLAPSISPKKSWMGFWGGMAFSIVAAGILKAVGILDLPWVHCFLLAAIVHCGGVCGDLFESLWKRHFKVKDSGKAIPGHGGMLDRFDSTLVAVPMGAIYLSLLSLF
ncbi:MAG: phosphatidate cytidylyltransferase [Bacteroidales bacterium]|nr:phosphatidate cytidylyltransferase [Bacteroidales bacterium]